MPPLAPSWRAPWRTWTAPAGTRARYAEIPTPLGTYTLFREPGRRLTATARAEARERWQFRLGEDTVLEVDDAAAPWYGMRVRMRRGVRGRLDGVPFTAHARGRSLSAHRRGIHFTLDDGRTLSFTVHRLHRHLVRRTAGTDTVISRTHGGGWETRGLDRGETALLCLVTVASLDRLLDPPLLELL
ncbi:hypothetical protein AVW11_17805 [Streptomyces amritsarensis]|uniref:Uncharacterized protein n=1 Tax=Streptomyces amritsarensis TaxID=681158 RepID=A0ABX3G1T1_9ACTN|nr:hypothetical protein [Streptomyces amritsarensis]OLZ65018.1 hypothetical protein AVW11_17805 [Streptomyces amritsarensis]